MIARVFAILLAVAALYFWFVWYTSMREKRRTCKLSWRVLMSLLFSALIGILLVNLDSLIR